MPEATVLIISDSGEVISGIQVALVSTVYSIHTARNASAAERFLAAAKPEIVLVELDIKQTDATPFYAKVHEYSPSSEVILLCHFEQAKLASGLVSRNAAYDYFIVNPLYDSHRLPIMIHRALEKRELATKSGHSGPALGGVAEVLHPPSDAPGGRSTKDGYAPVERAGDSMFDPAAVKAMELESMDSATGELPAQPSASGRKKREKSVLVIEDNEATMDLIEDILTCMDYGILKADTAIKGIEIAREKLPDLILLDVMLPGMSGIEALQKLKRNLLTAEIPVIMMTSLSDKAVVDQCLKAQCDDYIVKPFTKEILEDRVRRQLADTGRDPTRL